MVRIVKNDHGAAGYTEEFVQDEYKVEDLLSMAAHFKAVAIRENVEEAREIFLRDAIGTHSSYNEQNEPEVDVYFMDQSRCTIHNDIWKTIRGW